MVFDSLKGASFLKRATKDAVRAMKDLAGNSRLSGGAVDMGCYETPLNGLTLIVR